MKKKITFLFLIITISSNGLAKENLPSGIWCRVTDANNPHATELMIRIYDKPVNSQLGYIIDSHHTFEIFTVDSAILVDRQLTIVSNQANIRISGSQVENSDLFQITQKRGQYSNKLQLRKVETIPEWAKPINHFIYTDGTYEAKGDPSYWGHQPYCKLTVKKGMITDVIYYEKNFEDGDVKDDDYGNEYKEDLGEIAYAGAQLSVMGAQVYKYQFLLSQDIENVDVVTGATASYHRFKNVVNKALKDAVKAVNGIIR